MPQPVTRKLMVLWRPTRPFRTNTQKRCPFHYRGLEGKSRKSRYNWSNRQIWPWNMEWSRTKANRVLPRKCTGYSKQPLPKNTREDYTWTSPEGQYRNQIDFILCSQRWRSSISLVHFSRSVMSNSLWIYELQHARPPCPSPTPGVHSDSHPLSQWCHPAISSSVIPLSSCPQSLPASESFPMSQLFTWGGQSTGVSASASFPPKKSQGWSPSEWTVWISFQSKGLSRVFSNTTVQKHQFFGAQPSSQSNSHIHTWPQEKP